MTLVLFTLQAYSKQNHKKNTVDSCQVMCHAFHQNVDMLFSSVTSCDLLEPSFAILRYSNTKTTPTSQPMVGKQVRWADSLHISSSIRSIPFSTRVFELQSETHPTDAAFLATFWKSSMSSPLALRTAWVTKLEAIGFVQTTRPSRGVGPKWANLHQLQRKKNTRQKMIEKNETKQKATKKSENKHAHWFLPFIG